jgi:nucleotide-binding universal stress UspA family protein
MHRILAAYDGSPSSQAAFDFALELAQRYEAEVSVVAVVRPPELAEDVETEAIIERSRENLEKVLRAPAAKAAAANVPCTTEIVVGHPAERIVVYAEGHAIDHIVVGHRGHTFFERWLIGSVARQVIAYAPCAVTVVRPTPSRQA